MIRSAQLRVYVPAGKAASWEAHDEAPRGRTRLDDHFLWDESGRNDAYLAEWNGLRMACPRFPRLRMLEGILAFATAYPGVGAMLLSESVVRRAADELDALKEHNPDVKSHILTSPWHVPLRWFAAFDPDEREIVSRRGHNAIRYRTGVAAARQRLERAIEILREAGFDPEVSDQVADVLEWLDQFSNDGMFELDYAGVADLFSDGSLALDNSADDVHASLAALADGDYVRAGEHYADVAGRWAPAQALLYSN